MAGDPASSSPLIGQLILIVILTLINAFFAGAEIAFVSVNHQKLENEAENGDKKSQRVLRLLDNSDDFLSTIQIAITLAGFLNSASAATTLAQNVFAPLLMNLGIPGAETLAVVIVTLLISYITLVFGELYPKALALQMPETFAKNASGVIYVVQKALKPIIWLLSASTNVMKRITPVDFTATEERMTRDEFRYYLDQSRQDEVIDRAEFSMLHGVLSLDNKITREVMIPRTEAFMIDYDDGTEHNLQKLLDLQYSRVPMYNDEVDQIMGVIHVKNLLKASVDVPLNEIDLKDIMNDPLYVPETIFVDDLLYEMQRTNNAMAIVVDEYGGVVGLITVEDIIEEIVGDIEDEYDELSHDDVQILTDGEFLVEGSMLLHDFNEYFNTAISSEAVDSIGGYFVAETGIIPNESISEERRIDPEDKETQLEVNDLILDIHSVEGTRINQIHVISNRDEDSDVSPSEENIQS